MHAHALMVTSARLLCKMSLLSILLLAVIANGIGHSHRLTQEPVIMHKEICQLLLLLVVGLETTLTYVFVHT